MPTGSHYNKDTKRNHEIGNPNGLCNSQNFTDLMASRIVSSTQLSCVEIGQMAPGHISSELESIGMET